MTPTAKTATMAKARPAVMSGFSTKAPMAAGTLLTMPAKMMKLTPLPIPRSVISSPSHMARIVPAVSVTIWVHVSRLAKSKSLMTGSPPVSWRDERSAR